MKMTLGQANERITELDDLIFKVETGQVPMSWEEYQSLKIEVEALMDVLAQNLSSHTGHTYEQAYEPRQNVRMLEKMGAIMKRHIELHPEDRNKNDPLIIAALHGGKDGRGIDFKAFDQLSKRFDYIFENRPRPPAGNLKGFLRRLFRGSLKKRG
jgi:uncharacterized protein YdcH (DUF465 family)